MPFSKTSEEHTEDYWNQHFDSFLKPTIEEVQTVKAVRSEALRGDILRQIITSLVISPIVVANLTDHNPNVYWELGIRQSFKHGTITIAESGTKLPFDLSAKGTLFYYPKDYIKNEGFKRQFKKALQDCISHPEVPDSPVLETISGRGSIFEFIRRDEAIRRVKALISECDRNLYAYQHTIDLCKKNQENDAKPPAERLERQYVTMRLSCACIELLITNRYLDEDDSFYLRTQHEYGNFIAVNEQLSIWEVSPDITERWFMALLPQYIDSLNQYRTTLMSILGKLSTLRF
jgi:hypothetical protein